MNIFIGVDWLIQIPIIVNELQEVCHLILGGCIMSLTPCMTHWLWKSINAPVTPKLDQLKTDLRVAKFWISWTRELFVELLRPVVSQASVYTEGASGIRVGLMRIGKVIRVTFHSQCHSGVARKPLISQSGQFVERLETDLRPCRLTYESQSDLRPTCEQLATEIRSCRVPRVIASIQE